MKRGGTSRKSKRKNKRKTATRGRQTAMRKRQGKMGSAGWLTNAGATRRGGSKPGARLSVQMARVTRIKRGRQLP
jgi:hypothetical protein